MTNLDYGAYFGALAFLIPFLILATNWLMEYTGIKSNKRKREEANAAFEKIVENLSSDNTAAQLSSAVLLRRYLTLKIGKSFFLKQEAINVISAILRTLPTGVYQKTLADGLAYTPNLSNVDLQRTNLQNAYFGSKTHVIDLCMADFYMSNLTYALIDNVKADGIILYDALLHGTIIKNSDFSNANFCGADLTNARFTNVILKGANFSKATNIPKEISARLLNDIYPDDLPVTTIVSSSGKTIFFSMPGYMSKADELTVLAYKQYLIRQGFEVVYYNRDTYPRFGQLSHIKATIEKCAALVAFGTKQTFIKTGTYRPGMNGEKELSQRWLSTPWNEVEVGMATMAGLPILLVKDMEIEDGVFDDVLSESFIFTIGSKSDIKELDKNLAFSAWLSRI